MSTYRVVVQSEALNNHFVNVWYVTGPALAEQDIWAAWVDCVQDPYVACLNAACELESLSVTNVDTLSQYTEAVTAVGTLTGDMLPPQCAGLISWRTGLAGRRYRGRTYVPALSEVACSNGTTSASYQLLLDALAVAISELWPSTFNGTFVIYHRDSNAVTPVSGYISREIIYTQRRRTIGRGT